MTNTLPSSGKFSDRPDRFWGLIFRLSTKTRDQNSTYLFTRNNPHPPAPSPKKGEPDQSPSSRLEGEFRVRDVNSYNSTAGFTVIELLVVIVIIGVLAAIGIPSMLNQTSKARHAEAKTYIGALNRSQQTFYLENRRFTADLKALDMSIPSETESYNYSITNLDGQQPGDPLDSSYRLAIVNWAIPKDTAGVRAYLGVVDTVLLVSGVGSAESILCEQGETGSVNLSGYSSGNNYTVVTNSGDPTEFPECAAPFQGFR